MFSYTPCFGIGQYHIQKMGYWGVIHDKKDKSQVLQVKYRILSITQGNGAEEVHG
jgi:hypothetical protein